MHILVPVREFMEWHQNMHSPGLTPMLPPCKNQARFALFFDYGCSMNFEHYLATRPGLIWICILTPVFFALLGNFLARKWIHPDKRNPHHTIAHAILGPAATIFGILAAFMVATTWNEYTTTRVNLNEESNALRDLYFTAQAFSPKYCQQIRALCRTYRQAVMDHEWKIVVRGEDDLAGNRIIKKLSKLYLTYPIQNEKERFYFGMSVDNLEKLFKHREQRIQDSFTGLLPLLWILFILGATTLMSISLLMISSPGKTHGLLSILLAAMIGIMTFAIISLDFPFIGFAQMSKMPLEMILMEEEQTTNCWLQVTGESH